jgi:hypothetical protein
LHLPPASDTFSPDGIGVKPIYDGVLHHNFRRHRVPEEKAKEATAK